MTEIEVKALIEKYAHGIYIGRQSKPPMSVCIQHMEEFVRELDAIRSTPPAAPVRVEDIAHKLTGLYGSTCCHRTGGKSDDPDCECRKVAAEIAALSASPSPVDSRELIERLVKALKPFAQAASVLRTVERTTGREFKDEDAFQSGLAWNNDGIVTTITYGHLRAARVALAAKEQQP